MDEMRATLDSLLGPDRNELPEERSNRPPAFDDPSICKYYLLAFCPHDLFPNTRTNLGPCTRIHSDELKTLFENSPDKARYLPEFEKEMEEFLERLIEQADQKIAKANRRIDASLPENALLTSEQQRLVEQLNSEITTRLKEAEEAGERGDVEEASALTRQVSSLKKEVEKTSASLYGSYMQREKSLRVCSICGAMQSVGDSMSRFESHVTGKLHQGFEKIRSFHEDLQNRRKMRQQQNSNGRGLKSSTETVSGVSNNTQSGTASEQQSPIDERRKPSRYADTEGGDAGVSNGYYPSRGGGDSSGGRNSSNRYHQSGGYHGHHHGGGGSHHGGMNGGPPGRSDGGGERRHYDYERQPPQRRPPRHETSGGGGGGGRPYFRMSRDNNNNDDDGYRRGGAGGGSDQPRQMSHHRSSWRDSNRDNSSRSTDNPRRGGSSYNQ